VSGNTLGLPIVGGTSTGVIGRGGFASGKRLLTTMANTGVSAPIDCRGFNQLRLQFQLKNFSNTPVGTFNFYGAEDAYQFARDIATGLYGDTSNEGTQWTKLTLSTGFERMDGSAAGSFAFTSPGTDVTTDGSAAINALVILPDPPGIVRVLYTRTSGGGSATDLRILASLREI
jgi:hypothetical protein